MKKTVTKFFAVLLVLSLLLSSGATLTFAAETGLTASVESESGMPGESVKVNILLSGNTGLTSLNLNVAYSDLLTLKNVEFNSEFGSMVTAAEPYNNPQTLSFISPFTAVKANGVFATLTFLVSDKAKDGDIADISLTYNPEDVIDGNDVNIPLNVKNGKIDIFEGLPGDINKDGKVTNADAIALFRYVAGWKIEVDTGALDCNGDGSVNNSDAIALFRYLAHWKDVKITRGKVCIHNLTKTEAKAATCTEDGNIAYWYCSLCEKYFSDENATQKIALENTVVEAKGHNVVIDPAVPADYEHTGLTEGSHCSVCNKVLVEQEVVPKLMKDEYSIKYYVNNSDTYLASLNISNSNPTSYTGEKTITLSNLHVDGYKFDGWFDGEGDNASRVTNIPKGNEGNVELFAHWSEITYTIDFSTPFDGHGVESKTYTVSKGATLPKPYIGGYAFLGWTDENADKWISSIPKGTTGNITLEGTWTSLRNRTKPVSKLGEPQIVTDSENGEILFVYYIGDVENVPLYQIGGLLQNVDGLATVITENTTHSISTEEASKVSKSTSNATTNSEAWSLSQNWNDVTAVDESWCETHGVSKTDAEAWSKTSSDTRSINSTSGGATTTVDSSGYSGMASTTNTNSHTNTNETAIGMDVSVNTKIGASASASIPKIADVSASCEIGSSIGGNASDKTVNTGTLVSGATDNNGWTEDHCNTSQATWCQGSGYSHSDTTSHSKSTSKTVSDVISKAWGFSSSHEEGGGVGQDVETSSTNSESNEFSTTITYNVEDINQESKQVSTSGEKDAYYRLVCAGTEHVFAVVGYSVADASYYTYTYAVTDTETTQWIDQSLISTNFDDNENGVLPFEVPYFVKEYVDSRIAKTDGLQVNLKTGSITGYSGSDTFVYVPDFWRISNQDGTYSSIKIKSIDSKAFSGNKDIMGVRLSDYVNDIPKEAFDGCGSLKGLYSKATVIGERAFNECSSLEEFYIDKTVTSLGEYAFSGADSVIITASDVSVAQAATTSGAKNITLDISNLTKEISEAGGLTVSLRASEVTYNPSWISNESISQDYSETDIVENQTKYFELRGLRHEYKNLKVISGADKTVLNGINFTENTSCPLTVKSKNLTLNQIDINSYGLAMKLLNDNTDINLFGTNIFTSACGNALVCRNISFAGSDSSVLNNLEVSGNVNVYGNTEDISGSNLLNITNGQLNSVEEITYYNLINEAFRLDFNSSYGSECESKTAYYGVPIGTLPKPTRKDYSFLGWFTEPTNGTLVTESTYFNSLDSVTLYAHWSQNTVSVTFNPNGGTCAEASREIDTGSAIGTLPVPVREGYNFTGWFTAADGGTQYTASAVVNDSITLYAQWQVKQYSLSWNNCTGCNITVTRVASPSGHTLRTMRNPDTVNYGDVLNISYSAQNNYTLTSCGATTITVNRNITAGDIFATAKENEVFIGDYRSNANATDCYLELYKVNHTIRIKGYAYGNSAYLPLLVGWGVGNDFSNDYVCYQNKYGTVEDGNQPIFEDRFGNFPILANKSNVSLRVGVPDAAKGHMIDFTVPEQITNGARLAVWTNFYACPGTIKICDTYQILGETGLIF